MSHCQFKGKRDVENFTRNKYLASCFDIQIGVFAKYSRMGNGIQGLVSSGYNTCLGVVAHDIASNSGCLAHLAGNSKPYSFSYAIRVIDLMVTCLTNDINSVEIFLFEGEGFRGFYDELSKNEKLRGARIYNHLVVEKGTYSNYVYLPESAKIYQMIETKPWVSQATIRELKPDDIRGPINENFHVVVRDLLTAEIEKYMKDGGKLG